MKLSEEQIAELREKHGELAVFEGDTTLVFKRPTKMQYKQFQDALSSDRKSDFTAICTLLGSCVVHPGASQLGEIMEEFPGLANIALEPLIEMVSGAEKWQLKKVSTGAGS